MGCNVKTLNPLSLIIGAGVCVVGTVVAPAVVDGATKGVDLISDAVKDSPRLSAKEIMDTMQSKGMEASSENICKLFSLDPKKTLVLQKDNKIIFANTEDDKVIGVGNINKDDLKKFENYVDIKLVQSRGEMPSAEVAMPKSAPILGVPSTTRSPQVHDF